MRRWNYARTGFPLDGDPYRVVRSRIVVVAVYKCLFLGGSSVDHPLLGEVDFGNEEDVLSAAVQSSASIVTEIAARTDVNGVGRLRFPPVVDVIALDQRVDRRHGKRLAENIV
jgi:hypothetical protein